MVVHFPVLDLAQRLWTGADELNVVAVQVKHVGRRVDHPEVAIHVEGVQARGSRYPLRGHGLDDVALDDVLLELGHKRLVPRLADVRAELVSGRDGRLGRERDVLLREDVDNASYPLARAIVGRLDRLRRAGDDVRDDLDGLVDVVKDEDGVAQHEDGLGDREGLAQLAPRLGLKVVDAVVGDKADGAAWREGKKV